MRCLIGSLVVLALVSCSDVGDALVDVGRALSPDAAAQLDASAARARVIEVPCNGQGIFGARWADGRDERWVTYYASANDPAIDPTSPDVSAVVCGIEVLGVDPDARACPPDAVHCTDDRPVPLDCVSVPVALYPGVARVVCDSSDVLDVDGTSGPSAPVENGHRYAVARFVIR